MQIYSQVQFLSAPPFCLLNIVGSSCQSTVRFCIATLACLAPRAFSLGRTVLCKFFVLYDLSSWPHRVLLRL